MTVTARAPGDLLTATIFNTKIEGPILTAEIGDGQITTAKLAAGAVTADKLGAPPQARAYHSLAQSIASGVLTTVLLDSERFDTAIMHDVVVNTDRLTCKMAGLYVAAASVRFAQNALGMRQLRMMHNGTFIVAYALQPGTGAGPVFTNVATIVQLALNDYLSLSVYQDSGVTLDIDSSARFTPEFAMVRIGA